MYDNGSPEREPQLDAFSEARVLRTRTVASSISNIELGIPPIYAEQSAQNAQTIDMQRFYNGSYPVPDARQDNV